MFRESTTLIPVGTKVLGRQESILYKKGTVTELVGDGKHQKYQILWNDNKSSAHSRGPFWERLNSGSEDGSSEEENCSRGGNSKDDTYSISSEDIEEEEEISSPSSSNLIPISG